MSDPTEVVPLKDDPAYPELLRELARLMTEQLQAVDVNPDQAEAVAETVTEHVREHFGGVPLYWPKGDSFRRKRRRAAMWRDFTGNNHHYLARKYGMCLQQVYKWLAIAKREASERNQSTFLPELERSLIEGDSQ